MVKDTANSAGGLGFDFVTVSLTTRHRAMFLRGCVAQPLTPGDWPQRNTASIMKVEFFDAVRNSFALQKISCFVSAAICNCPIVLA